MVQLSVAEIIDVARQIERSGEAFYRAAAEQLRHPGLRRVFSFLRDEEARHSATFEELLAGLEDAAGEWRHDEEYLAYMRALSAGRIFPDAAFVQRTVAGLRDEAEAIRLAMGFEKDTILYLHGLRSMVDWGDQGFIDRLIGEEQGHLRTLHALLEEVGQG